MPSKKYEYYHLEPNVPTNKEFEEIFNKLGQDGWLFIGECRHGSHYHLVFMRELHP